jgi:glutamate dehydrogenase (NAD(P)+)
MSAESAIFALADDLGPAKVIAVTEPRLGLRAALVVDNVARGPAIGGLRMAPDVTITECFRLARAMTLKNAAAGIPHGGGKSVLWGDPTMPAAAKESLVRAFARAIGNETGYIVGPDMGTDERCMAWVKDEIGRAVGLPASLGGIPLDEIGATGWGLRAAIEVAAVHAGVELRGARVAVQGFGAVGSHAARFLAETGAVLVAAADSSATLLDPSGLDLPALLDHRAARRPLREFEGLSPLPPEAVLDVECEIWIPAARPDVIRDDNVHRLKTRIVAEGANIPATESAERTLHERGVLVLPDFIANAGGVICAAVEYNGGTQGQAFDTIREKIAANTEEVLATAARRGVLPREAAFDMAAARVREAMSLRRFSIL